MPYHWYDDVKNSLSGGSGGGSGLGIELGPVQSYTFTPEDLANPDSWFGGGSIHQLSFTPTRTDTVVWAPPSPMAGQTDVELNNLDCYIFTGTIPGTDFPDPTTSGNTYDYATHNVNGLNADTYPGKFRLERILLQKDQPYTIIIVDWSGSSGGRFSLDGIISSLIPVGWDDSVHPSGISVPSTVYVRNGKLLAKPASQAFLTGVFGGTGITIQNGNSPVPTITATGGGGGSGVVQTVVAGTNVTVDSTDPANPVVSATSGGTGTVQSVVAGTNVTVDATDPTNPIVSAASSGGGSSRVHDGTGDQAVVVGDAGTASGLRSFAATGGAASATQAAAFGGTASGIGSFVANAGGATGARAFAANNGQANATDAAAVGTSIADGAGAWSEAQGIAHGPWSHAENDSLTTVDAEYSHAEGTGTTSAPESHAEGHQTHASATAAHSEGLTTAASQSAAHAEGQFTTASAASSHAEGNGTTASGTASHAGGEGATAARANEFARGAVASGNDFKGQFSQVYGTVHAFGAGNPFDMAGVGFPITDNCLSVIRGQIAFRSPDGLTCAGYILDVVVDKTAGVARLVGTATVTALPHDVGASDWSVSVELSGANLSVLANTGGTHAEAKCFGVFNITELKP